jgi:hypothetical protein
MFASMPERPRRHRRREISRDSEEVEIVLERRRSPSISRAQQRSHSLPRYQYERTRYVPRVDFQRNRYHFRAKYEPRRSFRETPLRFDSATHRRYRPIGRERFTAYSDTEEQFDSLSITESETDEDLLWEDVSDIVVDDELELSDSSSSVVASPVTRRVHSRWLDIPHATHSVSAPTSPLYRSRSPLRRRRSPSPFSLSGSLRGSHSPSRPYLPIAWDDSESDQNYSRSDGTSIPPQSLDKSNYVTIP